MTESLLNINALELCSFKRLFVAFSGGLDSSVLLHRVASLPMLLNQTAAIHINHGLSPDAMTWQAHCQSICQQLHIPLIVREVTFDRAANIEEGARNARLAVFASLLEIGDGLLLAHHCDDQAETLLLHLIRGAGVNGLSAMPRVKNLGKGKLIRPLLSYSRKALEDYAILHKLKWIEDESNQNDHFSRNYLRNQIMPLLKKKWPEVAHNMSRSASHCQQAQTNLKALATIDGAFQQDAPYTLCLSSLLTQSPARVVNVLRAWFSANQIRMPSLSVTNRILNEVIFAQGETSLSVAWGTLAVRRYQTTLYLLDTHPIEKMDAEWDNFPDDLVLNQHAYLHASLATSGLVVPRESKISVRTRQGGEVFYFRGQTKSLKKLYQEWQIPPWQRAQIPLIYIDHDLAAVVGYAISDKYYAKTSDNDSSYKITFCPT